MSGPSSEEEEKKQVLNREKKNGHERETSGRERRSAKKGERGKRVRAAQRTNEPNRSPKTLLGKKRKRPKKETVPAPKGPAEGWAARL